MKLRTIGLALVLVCGGAVAVDKPAYFAAHYACEGGLRIRVAYPVDPLAGHPITLRYEGQRVTMRHTLSASGARYENRAKKLEWFIKGNEGMLIDGANDRTVQCRTSPSPQ